MRSFSTFRAKSRSFEIVRPMLNVKRERTKKNISVINAIK